ncbi:MAG: O-GlcNAc transferase [Planctomycetes bacterium]|nr:O-GlcNAc transferase [Planctomycetota bacterium]MCB9869303.1 O-GlcNAc transferase [Planctomycetota bacterium]
MTERDGRRGEWIYLVVICVAAVVAYWPALRAGFIWDDDQYVLESKVLNNPSAWAGLVDIWCKSSATPQYYPLVHTTFWLESRLWGLLPLGFHVVNLLLHLTGSVLLFVVVRRLAIPGALLAAGVFALHPVMVESVAWVTERKNVLSVVFYLGSALWWFRFAGLDRRPPLATPGERLKVWFASFGLFACALMSKSVTFSLPFALLVLTWWRRGRVIWRDALPLLPFMVLGVAYGAFTSYLEHTQVGARGPEFTDTWLQKVLIAGRVPWFYLGKLLWPAELVFIYRRWDVDPAQLWQWAFPLLTVATVLALWLLRRRIGRSPLTAILLFGGTLFPALGFISVFPFRYSYVADHFQYHASIAVIVLCCAAAARWVPGRIGVPLAIAVLAGFGVRTFVQCGIYRDKETLYDSILAAVPDSWFAHNNLAAIYVTRGEIEKGFAFYRRTKELNPELEPGPEVSPEAYANCMVGKMIANSGGLKDALRAFQNGNVEEALARRQRIDPVLDQAARHFSRAIELAPRYVDALKDSGKLLQGRAHLTKEPEVAQKMLERAVGSFERAVSIAPADRDARTRAHNLHMQLAEGLRVLGKIPAAQAHYAAAVRLRNEDPERRVPRR